METRVALISMIVQDQESALEINALLHAYRQYIIGRMGIPYAPKKISIISIAIDAPQDIILSLIHISFGGQFCHVHKILIPSRSFHLFHVFSASLSLCSS